MANPNDNLYRLYQNGLKHFSLPDFDTFKQDMMDEQKRRRFYTNMQAAYTLPDFDTFSKDIGTVAPPPAAAPAQPAEQAQPQQQAVTHTVQPIKDNTAQQASVQSATTPAQPAGWKPSPEQQYMQRQMDQANQRLKKMGEDFQQRMEGIDKGNRPGTFKGEREFNPQTGQMETHYYTQQGERVGSRMEQSRRNSEYNQWWENNTEAGKRSKEQRLQREFDDRLSHLWEKHNPKEGENAAEQAWSAAEKRQGIDRNRIADDVYGDKGDAVSNAVLLGGPQNHIMNAAENSHRSMVAHFTNFDLDRIMNESWDNLGEDGQKALIDDCYQMLRYRNPGADELVLYNQAKQFARQQSDLRLYNLAVEKNMPNGNLEYLMRKIGDMNLLMNVSKGLAVSSADGRTGDMAAYEAANEQYRQDGHKILDVTGMVAGFALDPTTWLSAGVGSAATRGAMWAGGRWLAGRGASAAVTQSATRQFATSMTGRIVGGIAGGAANFGTFEGAKEIENQFAHGGKVATMDENGNLLREGRYVNEGYSAGAVAGQFGHGLMMGAAVGWLGPVSGNVSDKLVRATSSTAGKVATRAGVYTGATLAEGTIFSVPEWIEGERDAMDVWNDNMTMMVGFKAKHMLKSAGGVLGDLKASFDSPTNGQKNRLDFESRLCMRMDAPSDGGMALSKDEKAELSRYGYGDLRDLVESSERTGDAAEGSLITRNAPEIVSRLTDMVQDTRVSEAARAKMYYYATGRRLPMSTVMRGELIEDGDGGFIVESQGANGVITSRSFKSRKAADIELARIKRQTELNSIEIGERYQQTADFENRLQEACRTVAAENGWDMVEVYRTCEEARRNHLRGRDKEMDEAQQNILRKVTEAMGEFEETGATDAMRGRINEKYGVDIDGAIRKEAKRRTQQEQTAIDEYIAELIPDKAKEPNPVEDAQAEDITNQKLLSDEPAELQGSAEREPMDPRFDNSTSAPEYDPPQPEAALYPKGRAVMKYQDRPVEVLSGRVVMMEDGSMIDNERSDATIVIRDVVTGKIEMVSPEAILSYEEYAAQTEEAPAMPGDTPETPEMEPQSRYTSGQIKIRNSDGTETRGWLTGEVDENGNHEYYVEDDQRHLYYASDHELDNILSEYQPDEPQQPSAEQPQAAERVYPEGVTDTEAYDNGLEDGAASTSMTDEELNNKIARLSDENEVTMLTDYGRGWLDGLKQEQQRRIQAAQPQQPEQGAPIEPTHAPTAEPEPAQAPAEEPQGDVSMPTGVNPVGTISVPQRDGSTRTFTVGKDAEGQNIVVDGRGFMWAHDGNGGRVEPYRPGANVPTWTDEQLSKLGAVQSATEQPATVPNQPESVPTSAETPRNPLENAVLPDESVPNSSPSEVARPMTVDPVENVQETPAPTAGTTPLQRIPRDAKGEPIFEQAENPVHGWDALVEFAEGDAATAKEIADTMAEEKRKAYEKARKQKPKGKNPTEILASKKAITAGLVQAEQEYNLWRQMADVEQRRQDAIRAQQEAEARQRAAERTEAENAEREASEEAARLEREALEGIPEWHLDTPENARKRGVRRFNGQMFTRQEPVQGVVGKEVEVKFSQKDLPQGHLAVIEAPQLQPSHIQGQRNPIFFIEEAQPKNRAEAVSMYAAKEMAEGIRPQEITGSATAYTGAPTVNTRGEVIQGNNRSDALRYLWENKLPEQQQTYKQYLIDNAEQFGLDPEAVGAMQQPVLVNMLDVDDAEAIRLGQMTAQDTESGGIERIKPKNVAQKLGEDMRIFASQLLRSGDEEATFGQLVDRNGTEVLKWMAQKGAITDTQYQSAFDSKGNLTAEAKNDLQKVLYQAVFKGGSQQLEEMFDALPAKAQRAILSTAFRDMDSPVAGQMLPEIQASIAAYHQLMSEPTFAAAKKMEEALRAVEAFKQSIQLDDRFEQYMPADNFSNFALHLAAMYKANDMSQSTIAGYFNQMYDLAQGKKAATLFDEADTIEYPLADVIQQVLNIYYQPAKNGNNDVANGGSDVALRNQDGQGGELRGNEPPASGKQNPTGTEPSDRGAGTSDDSRGGGNLRVGRKGETAAQEERLTKEEASGIIAEMEEKAIVAPKIELTIENWDAQFGEDGIVSTPIGNVKMGENQFTKLMRQGRNGKLGMIKPTLETPDIIIEDASEAKDAAATERESSYVFVKTFVKPDGSRYYYFASVTVSKDGHEVVISNQEKRRNVLTNLLMKGKLVWKHADDASSASDVADGLFSPQGNMSDPVSEGTDAPQTNDSDRKVNALSSDKQEESVESSAKHGGKEYETIEDREGYSIEVRHAKDGDSYAIRLKKSSKPSEWKKDLGEYGIWSSDGRGEILFDSFEAMTKYLESRGENVSALSEKAKWIERDKEVNDRLYAETGLREGQIWIGPDGTRVVIGARGYVKGPDGWDFSASVAYPDGRKESTLTPALRIVDFFKKNGYRQESSAHDGKESFSVGEEVASNDMVYEAAKELLESAGISVVEVTDEEAATMLDKKNTPVTGQPNRANEKLTSGSVLLSAKGDSSSNANVPSEVSAKIAKDTQKAKNNIKKFNNGRGQFELEPTLGTVETKGGRLRRLSDSQGRVYGWTVDGKVYLNRDAMNPETPLHEYTHLWDEMVQRENPELWSRGKELLKQTPMWEQVLHDPNYADIADDENAVASEVHSRLTGREGAKLLQDMIDDAKKDGALETARIVTLVEKLKGWLSDMFKALKATLGKWGKRDLRNLTVEDFNRMVIRDLADGVNPRHGDRSLIGVHNITEQKLMKALKIGGLVNPSVAVIDINRGKHEGYGEISLVLPSSKIDKGNGNVGTWPGDAWTPTYPTVERRMKGDGADLPGLDMAKLPEVMKEYVRRAFNGWLDGRGNEGMAYWFLHERGDAPDVVRRERIYTVQEASRILRNVKEKDSFGNLTRKPLSELTEEERATVKDAYIKHKFNGNEAAYNEAVHAKRELWEKLIKDYPETSFRHKSAARNLAKLEKTGLAPAVDSWLDEVQADINAGNRQLPESTSLEANKIINDKNLRNEFDKWVDSLTERYGIEEVIFDGYTPSGERRYVKNTAKNVSRLMREQGRNAATGWGTSFTRFVAAVMSHMPDKESIRKEKTRLTADNNAIDAFDGKWQDVFFELGLKCQPDATGRFDDYGLERLTEAVGYKDPVGYLKKEYGVELSAEDVMKLMSMIDAIRRERPAKYFETKFERPVQLDEFSAAVVPATIEPMLEKAITDAGLKVVKYDAKKEGDRQRALREASDDRSIRFQIMGERGAERLDRAEEVTMRLDNLAVAREMEKAKNSPRAIKIATGWERGADNLWRYEVPDFKIDPKGLARKNSLWNNLPWGKDFDELSDKIIEGGELTEEESVRFDKLAEMATEMRKLYEESDVRYLDDYVMDKELFEAYPEFKHMRVEMYDDPMDSKGGAYYFSQKLIRINVSKLGNFGIGNLRSVLAHEVQHAIQEAESFTKGGTPEEAYDTIKKNGYEFLDGFSSNQLYDLSRLKREAEDCVKEGKYKYLTNAVKHILKEERKHSWYAWIDRHDSDGNFTLVYDVLLEFTSDELYAAAEIDTAEFYHRISGEVEARNVQKRMRMTADRRRRSLLQSTEDVSREDQIFLWLHNKHSAVDLGMLRESGAEYNSGPHDSTSTNEQFNKQIEGLNEENADKVILSLGRPSPILLSAGIEDRPLKLYGNKVIKKIKKHGFALEELRNLPESVAAPIAVFDNLGRNGNRSILTELHTAQGNVLVTVDLGKGGDDIDFNVISSVFGKGTEKVVLWIEKGYATYMDKEKVLDYLHHSAPIAEALSSPRLDSVAKVVKSFENPTIEEEDLFRTEGISANDNVRAQDTYERMVGKGSEYGASPEGDIRFREVEDDAVLKEFAEGKTVKAYRTMQVIDGKLYSPMATKVGGKATPEIKLGVPEQAEEHPEIIKKTIINKDGNEQGIVVIDKGLDKGSLKVAYNPYVHTSRTVLNDQFSSAYKRPNLVTVEVEVPESEMTSGYRANKAKNTVGEMPWHSGTVSGQLAKLGKPRRVILSRYDRPVRIVPFKEVAAMIAEQLDGTDIEIPYNVVQPQVRAELERLGVAIGEEATGTVDDGDFGEAEYVTDQEIDRINARQQEMAQTSPEAKSSHAEKLAKKFNTPIQVVTDTKELTSDNAERQARMRRSKGFYDPATGKVVVVLPNNANVEDVAETVFHEVVAHKGLREMLGDENYDTFCDEVYNHLKDDLKEEVDRETTRRFEREPEKGYEHHRRVSVDEMFGRLAEKGFEDFTKAERGIWAKLKAKVLEAINKFLGSLKLPKWVRLGDNELRYMLWRSHEKLRSRGSTPNDPSGMDYVDMARDAVKRKELGLSAEVIVTRPKKSTPDRIEEAFDAAVSGDLKGKPLEVGKLTQEGRAFLEKLSGVKMKENVSFVLNPSDLVHIYRRHYGKNEKDGRNIPLTKEDVRQISEIVSSPDRIVFGKETSGNQRNMFFFLKEANDGSYNLMEVYSDKKGNLTAKSFFKSKEGVSQRAMLLNESSTLTSVTDGATLSDGAKLPKFFESATDSEGESFELRYRDGETGDIWKDRSVGLQERITNAAIRLSNNQRGDLTLRNDAQKAVVNNLQSLLHSMRNRRGTAQSFIGADRKVRAGVVGAMNAQAMFDRATVKRVSDLARILMQNGYLSGMTSGEMQRLLSAVKNATAMHDISDSVQKIMDIMVNNQLRNAEGALLQLLQVRGSKVDARGVEVQGVLDVDGQRTMEVVKKAMSLSEDDITDRIAEAQNRMGDSNKMIADNAALEYAGLNMALDYVQNIANSKAEEKAIRDSLKTAKEDRDAGYMTDDAYRQFVGATEDAIRKNKVERAEAYFNLVGRLSDSLRESIENAKAFRESEKERVQRIHHYANSDMEGRAFDEHGMKKKGLGVKLSNNMVSRLLLAPAATFEQIMRVFGRKSVDGEGYLFDCFVRGWQVCRDKEWISTQEVEGILNNKAAEILGKRKARWSDLYALSRKAAGSCEWWDGGQIREHKVTQGNLMYIYMVNKMIDGQVKLRRMCITDDKMQEIEQTLDPKLKAVADWLQEELLPNLRNRYNEVYMRMYGAPMAEIENYFSLRILANARLEEVEMAGKIDGKDLPKTMTGAIIKRRYNNYALDILNSDAISVALDHIREMETWAAFAEYRRDLCTLLSYKHFRNQVKNMSTIYGSGEKFWDKFYDLSLLVGGAYQPKTSEFDKATVNITKLATGACIAIRLNTALKQLLSYPAFAPDANLARLMYNMAPWRARACWKWAMKNMPSFQRRWKSRQAGNDLLRDWKFDWDWTRTDFVQKVQRAGITPNAFIDALTVAMGSEAVYHSKLKDYLKDGFSKEEAHRRAIQDAEIIFNLSQQSSELPYLSLLQNDRSYLTTCITNFRNSPMSYLRQSIQSKRELSNMVKSKDVQIEFETKKGVREGLTPEQAKVRAERKYKRNWARNLFKSTTFDYILPTLWAFGLSGIWYCIFGTDDEKKKQYAEDAMKRGIFGGLEGFTFGGTMPDFMYGLLTGEKPQLDEETSPAMGLITDIANLYSNGKTERAANEMINTMIALGIGFNPQVLEDGVVAGMDFFGEDEKNARDWALLFMRVLSCPQSQMDQVYFDELGMDAREAIHKSPVELAERYATYKARRANFATMWAYDDNRWESEAKAPWRKKFKKEAIERLDAQGDAKVIEAYADLEARYKAVSERVKEAKALMKTDYTAAAQAHAMVQQDPDFGLYQRFGALDKQLGRISKMWLSARSPQEAALVASTITEYRAGMVKVLQADNVESEQSAMSELTTLMNDFYAKYQGMQPKRSR